MIDFLQYLQSKGVIPHPGLADDLLRDNLDKREMFYMYCRNLSSEQISDIKNMVESKGLSFEDAAATLGCTGTAEDCLERGSEDHTMLRQAQAIVDAGICPAEEMNGYMLLYGMEKALGANTFDVSGNGGTAALLSEYLSIAEDCFFQLYKVNITHGVMVNLPVITNDFIFLQKVTGSVGSIVSGLAVNKQILINAAADLYKRLGTDMPPFSGTYQDSADLLCEAVNNINGFCTYRFNADYDLALAEYSENAMLTASGMYITRITFLNHVMDMFIIIGTDYEITKAVE